MHTNWWANTPYTGDNRGNITGLFPPILTQATFSCCGFCAEHNQTFIDFTMRSKKRSEQEVKNDVDDYTELSFPITGVKDQTSYSGTYGFVSVVKSGGAAFIVVAEDHGAAARKLVASVFDLWPLFMSMLMSVVISGLLLWMMVCTQVNTIQYNTIKIQYN